MLAWTTKTNGWMLEYVVDDACRDRTAHNVNILRGTILLCIPAQRTETDCTIRPFSGYTPEKRTVTLPTTALCGNVYLTPSPRYLFPKREFSPEGT